MQSVVIISSLSRKKRNLPLASLIATFLEAPIPRFLGFLKILISDPRLLEDFTDSTMSMLPSVPLSSIIRNSMLSKV